MGTFQSVSHVPKGLEQLHVDVDTTNMLLDKLASSIFEMHSHQARNLRYLYYVSAMTILLIFLMCPLLGVLYYKVLTGQN